MAIQAVWRSLAVNISVGKHIKTHACNVGICTCMQWARSRSCIDSAHHLCCNCLMAAQSTSATRPVSQTSPLARLRRSVYYIFVFFLTRSASWLLGSNFYWGSARPTARQFEDNHFIWVAPICTLFSVRSPPLSLWSLQLWLRLMG